MASSAVKSGQLKVITYDNKSDGVQTSDAFWRSARVLSTGEIVSLHVQEVKSIARRHLQISLIQYGQVW